MTAKILQFPRKVNVLLGVNDEDQPFIRISKTVDTREIILTVTQPSMEIEEKIGTAYEINIELNEAERELASIILRKVYKKE